MEQKKMKKIILRVIKIFLICIVFLGVLTVGAGYLALNYVYDKIEYQDVDETDTASENGTENKKEEKSSLEPFQVEGVKNILLIGNDSRKNSEDGRSDAMILVSINSKEKTIHMTSILRDIYVEIPGHKDNRLNAAYAFGGPELLMETLKENFDITVNRYILVNFQAFVDVVDAVGGVDLEVSNKEVQYINKFLVEYNRLEGKADETDFLDTSLSGMLHLNGAQALSYCRNRYIGTDFARTERQRKVLNAIFEKAPSALLSNTEELAQSILQHVNTNLKKKECAGLMLQAPTLLTYDMVQSGIPLEGTYENVNIRGMAVLQVDFEANKEYIQREVYGN